MKTPKLRYKQRLFLYFGVIFVLFTVGVVAFEQSRERFFKTQALEETLEAYIDVAHAALQQQHQQQQQLDSSRAQALQGLLALFPQNIRVTLIGKQGEVLYDNAIGDLLAMENHLSRPEVASARKSGAGTHVRTSASNSQPYLYYTKRYPQYYLRMALPYDTRVRHFLEADNLFIYFIAALFAVMLALIHAVTARFGKSIRQLRDFIVSAERDDVGALSPSFPQDELGEISTKITENYRLLNSSRKKIAQEREKLLQHVYTSGEGLCFFSAAGAVEFYNGLFIQYLNTITDEANGNPAAALADPSFGELAQFLKNPGSSKYAEAQIGKQGKLFAVLVNIFDDRSFEMIINDVTRQEKPRRLKQEMTGNIAHELRTPVTSIRGYLETILHAPLSDAKRRQFLNKAYRQTIALSELINDMSLITKIEGAPQSFALEPVAVGDLLEALRSDLEAALKEKSIGLAWSVGRDVVVHGSRSLLYSIFRNLTDNAIRYAGSGVSIQVSVYGEDKDFYYFSYADTGVGIGEQHLNRIFERFYRISEGRTRDTGGSGLGLSIVKNAVAFHKGSIVAKNRASGGLVFLFNLPKAGAQQKA
ncbi:MAG: HAMP domain-containing histidine kinase [Prevotellaceae bacterium]|jgi:signal transduction histidine kinase|nr:HAMP domain-containing histidine kinase [Prevotellaceae bacterium]